ncbi:unnamed protein product [Chrysodeixis includens]|uniref:PDZ domain-containing protein n=1 Tax=Chrysodeixis includens TaxID=689277 RepID=A0A9N8L5S8_CHRIL|nr:unnamed protein product [Chrysodeixis includens]
MSSCPECARRASRARCTLARDLEPCSERVMETISEDAEAELELDKIRKKYAGLGDTVVSVRLERAPRGGLGLSLAGHRDRSRMAVFVCGLHPAGAAAKASPPVKVGDEILEVNGIVLHGRCHLNASAIIKGLVGPVFKIILLRRKAALEDVAVKPLTPAQFPVALEEEYLKLNFLGQVRECDSKSAIFRLNSDGDDKVMTVMTEVRSRRALSEQYCIPSTFLRTIWRRTLSFKKKKGPSGLGIMIIEGRHTEAGRGIFVSDLQEGSAAEQGGLQIGDMLLAVNRDSLLNCSYDAAAAKLKQTEGVVVLTVCTPNLKDDKDDATPPTPPVEPPPDPATCPILPNVDQHIEINSANDVLGVQLLGGSDTLINGAAAIILDIYPNGAIAKDARLKVGDQILECNGIAITKEMAHERLCLTIKQKTAKLKLLIHRPDPPRYTEVEVELSRKAGRALGLTCVAPVQAKGVYLGQPLPGSPAELDGRLQKGDFLVAVDGKDVSTADLMGAATALKLCANKASIKVKRFKTVR